MSGFLNFRGVNSNPTLQPTTQPIDWTLSRNKMSHYLEFGEPFWISENRFFLLSTPSCFSTKLLISWKISSWLNFLSLSNIQTDEDRKWFPLTSSITSLDHPSRKLKLWKPKNAFCYSFVNSSSLYIGLP